jgi:translation initiation factor IF-3
MNIAEQEKILINDEIRALEVRVVGPAGEALGILPLREALARAREFQLDLIEVSAKAVPPVAKIMDYGKFTYEQKKKQKDIKANSFITETKSVQVKIGTGTHDKELKAGRAAEWLVEGHRVKVDLFLWGRYKYMEEAFLKDRLKGFLNMIKVPYKIADEIKRSPKGFSCTLERDKSKPVPSVLVVSAKDELDIPDDTIKE